MSKPPPQLRFELSRNELQNVRDIQKSASAAGLLSCFRSGWRNSDYLKRSSEPKTKKIRHTGGDVPDALSGFGERSGCICIKKHVHLLFC